MKDLITKIVQEEGIKSEELKRNLKDGSVVLIKNRLHNINL